jgi:hypothetical protein
MFPDRIWLWLPQCLLSARFQNALSKVCVVLIATYEFAGIGSEQAILNTYYGRQT